MSQDQDSPTNVPLKEYFDARLEDMRDSTDAKFVARAEAVRLVQEATELTARHLEASSDAKFELRAEAEDRALAGIEARYEFLRGLYVRLVDERKDLFSVAQHEAYAKARDDQLNDLREQFVAIQRPNWQAYAAVAGVLVIIIGGVWGLAFSPLSGHVNYLEQEVKSLSTSVEERHNVEGVTKRDIENIQRELTDNRKKLDELSTLSAERHVAMDVTKSEVGMMRISLEENTRKLKELLDRTAALDAAARAQRGDRDFHGK